MSGYADVILPLRVAGDFSYSIPSDFSGKVSVGKRVIVPVGSKLYAGIVHKLHDSPPHGITLKDIQDVMDDCRNRFDCGNGLPIIINANWERYTERLYQAG